MPTVRVEKESLQPRSQPVPPIGQIHHPKLVRVVHLVGNENRHQKVGKRMPPMPDIKNNKAHRDRNRRIPDNTVMTGPHPR